MLEEISAAASVATLVVLTAAAIAALVQLRHMQAGNELQAFIDINARANTPQMMRLFDLVLTDLPERMQNDPAYVADVVSRKIPSTDSPLAVAFWFDEVGIVLRQRLVPARVVFQIGASAFATVRAWTAMQPLIEALRRRSPASFLHFEYAAVLAQQWIDAHPAGDYPPNVPRWRDIAVPVSRAEQ
ncbi:MAG: hypothetical protein JO311_03620 [Candidatus Eremiobacteraeota bacterium]|nr:hypothetical protein [Candidatus Eremiobacteraeota bacterium]MBV9262964.1 hypothetical protein [Candidatus Eremiobacteraeota bacterium]